MTHGITTLQCGPVCRIVTDAVTGSKISPAVKRNGAAGIVFKPDQRPAITRMLILDIFTFQDRQSFRSLPAGLFPAIAEIGS